MRRLLAVTALAASAFGLAGSASATPFCAGVYAGDNTAGVCAGSECADECYLVVYPTCYLGTIQAQCAFDHF